MKKSIAEVFLLLGLVAGAVFAQPQTSTLTVNARVDSRYKLELTSNTVTFTRTGNPMTAPVVAQNEAAIKVTVKATTSKSGVWPQTFNLRIQAVGALLDSSSGAEIPVNAITWTAAGPGFVSTGTLAPSTDLILGTWNASGSYEGTISFSFQDNANYAPGVYRLTVTLSVGTS